MCTVKCCESTGSKFPIMIKLVIFLIIFTITDCCHSANTFNKTFCIPPHLTKLIFTNSYPTNSPLPLPHFLHPLTLFYAIMPTHPPHSPLSTIPPHSPLPTHPPTPFTLTNPPHSPLPTHPPHLGDVVPLSHSPGVHKADKFR